MRTVTIILLIVMFAGVAACTGGGDSTSVSSNSDTFDTSGIVGLSVGEKVTVVDAKSEGASGSSTGSKADPGPGVKADLAPYDVPGGTPYYSDETRVWVSERSAEVFGSVNSILCFISKLQYKAMLNQGDYVAQIDMRSCEENTDASGRLSEGGQSSSSENEVPQYTRWVVNSFRADASSPHIVKAWVEEEGREPGDYGGLIYALVTITESKSVSNPLGIFRLDYGGQPYLSDGSLDTTWIIKGFIRTYRDPATGEVLLNYVSDESHNGGTEIRRHQAVLNRDEAAGTGIGSVYAYSSYNEGGTPYVSEENYDFSYNDTHFLRGIYNASTAPVYDGESCYSRYFFDENVFRYGLYNATGQRVENFSGLPLRYNDGLQDYYGWIGYYGMWFPDQVTLAGGETVWSQDFDGGNLVETQYESFISGGKLLKYTRGTVQLGDIGNVPLNWGEDDGSGNWVNYIAIWNPSALKFQKTAIVDYNSGTTQDIADEDISLSDSSGNPYYNINFWSDSLGGSLRLDLMDAAGGQIIPDNNTVAITYNTQAVYPGTEDPLLSTNGLVCFENCPNAMPGVINGTSPMHPESTDWTLSYQTGVLPSYTAPFVNAVTYSFDSSRMQLVDDKTGLDVVLNEPSLWSGWNGMQTGPMLINTPANIDTYLACASGSPDLCAWKLWDNAPVFYVWETGTDQWNRLSALKDPSSGNFVSFDPPLKVEYTHNDPGSKYFGSKFFLEYNGFGDLWGIPGECTDKETGDPVQCGPDTWWTPSFSIPTGTELTNVATAEAYLAKGLEKEQKMKKTSTLLPCASFSLTHYPLPDISQWRAPLIGPMPVVTAPPRVIDGELL